MQPLLHAVADLKRNLLPVNCSFQLSAVLHCHKFNSKPQHHFKKTVGKFLALCCVCYQAIVERGLSAYRAPLLLFQYRD